MALYKHPVMRDIAFEIDKKFYVKEKDYYGVKMIYWLRIPCTNKYEPTNISEILVLSRSKVGEWEKVLLDE